MHNFALNLWIWHRYSTAKQHEHVSKVLIRLIQEKQYFAQSKRSKNETNEKFTISIKEDLALMIPCSIIAITSAISPVHTYVEHILYDGKYYIHRVQVRKISNEFFLRLQQLLQRWWPSRIIMSIRLLMDNTRWEGTYPLRNTRILSLSLSRWRIHFCSYVLYISDTLVILLDFWTLVSLNILSLGQQSCLSIGGMWVIIIHFQFKIDLQLDSPTKSSERKQSFRMDFTWVHSH